MIRKLPFRWLTPRFSLRTLLLATTLVALWLGWNHRVVQRRLEARQLILQDGGVVFVQRQSKVFPLAADGQPTIASGLTYDLIGQSPRITWVRRLLGDDTVDLVMIRPAAGNRISRSEVAAAFPEADILTTGAFSEYVAFSLGLQEADY